MSRTRYHFQPTDQPHFLTLTTVNWTPLFVSRPLQSILLDSLRFLQGEGCFTLYAFVVLENHLHLVAGAPDLSTDISRFKSYTARQTMDWLEAHGAQNVLLRLATFKAQFKTDREHQLWQEGSHPQLIQGIEMMRQKVEYIHQNPVKRGFVDDPLHWRLSSARNYAGLESVLAVKTEW
jgi:REP element-mobilizing transposase RayT